MTELRPYQAACVAELRAAYAAGHRAPLLALPTGGGKTHVFSSIAAGAQAKGKRVLVLVHRRELVRQAAAKLAEAGVHHGIIAAGFLAEPAAPVQVASVQTLARRAVPAADLVVIDEAHHARAAQWRAVLEALPKAKLLGVTATPARLDGKGLGIEAGGLFDALVVWPGIAELTREGFLSPARCFAPAQRLDLSGVRTRGGDYAAGDLEQVMAPSITGDAVAEYRQRADHLPALAFCVSVAHAQAVAEAFRAAGYRARAVHGGLSMAERDAAIGGLATGAVEVLASCDLVSEGLDVPAVGAVILLRPTKSLVLHMQQVGRGLRPAAGKRELTMLDHVGNTLAHGLPDAERRWTLAGGEQAAAGDKRKPAAPVWHCECGCINPSVLRACAACGEARPGAREIEMVPGVLAEITAARLERARRMSYREMLRARLSEAELRAFAKGRGYHHRWVQHRLCEQERPALSGAPGCGPGKRGSWPTCRSFVG